jgi:ABC-type multidrug transport system ATPase subunit
MVATIEISDLVKRFGAVTALAGVDMVVEEGEVHGLLSPNGVEETRALRGVATFTSHRPRCPGQHARPRS